MPWKTIKGRQYYWRFQIRHGKRIRRYVGGGLLGRLAEEADLLARQRRKERLAASRAWLARFKSWRNRLERIERQMDLLLWATLLVEGFYFRNRHEWRRRMNPGPAAKNELISDNVALREVTARANRGDEQALARLRAFLRANPKLASQWGNVAAQAMEAQLQRLNAVDHLAGESVRVALDELRKSLLSEDASPLHRLTVDRIVLIHLETYVLDTMYPLTSELEPQQARVVAKTKDSAQRRYSMALKTLAAVNKLDPSTKRRKNAVRQNPGLKVTGRPPG